MKPVVALDTNAFMMPIRNDIRVFDELHRLLSGFECVTLRGVVEELESLAESESGKEAMAASVGADLTERCRLIDHEESHADDAFVALARDHWFDYVVTNDRPLRDRLLAEHVPVIHLRGRHKLTITQP